jgi:hypothetical protein
LIKKTGEKPTGGRFDLRLGILGSYKRFGVIIDIFFDSENVSLRLGLVGLVRFGGVV